MSFCQPLIPIGFINVTFHTPPVPLIKGGAIKEYVSNSNPICIKNVWCRKLYPFKILAPMRKFLFRSLFATLGMSGLMIGLPEASLAANLSIFTQSEYHLEMLSSDSLDGVESRNHSEDYSEIFKEANPKSEWEPIVLNRPSEVSIVQIPAEILDLIQKVEVATGGSSLDSDQLFKMQYRMGFWLQ